MGIWDDYNILSMSGKPDYLTEVLPSVDNMLMKSISGYQNQRGGNMSGNTNLATVNLYNLVQQQNQYTQTYNAQAIALNNIRNLQGDAQTRAINNYNTTYNLSGENALTSENLGTFAATNQALFSNITQENAKDKIIAEYKRIAEINDENKQTKELAKLSRALGLQEGNYLTINGNDDLEDQIQFVSGQTGSSSSNLQSLYNNPFSKINWTNTTAQLGQTLINSGLLGEDKTTKGKYGNISQGWSKLTDVGTGIMTGVNAAKIGSAIGSYASTAGAISSQIAAGGSAATAAGISDAVAGAAIGGGSSLASGAASAAANAAVSAGAGSTGAAAAGAAGAMGMSALGGVAGTIVGRGIGAIGGGTDGMCVCAGTKVFTADGKIVNIEDLKKEDGIIGWRESTREVLPQQIHTLIEPRKKECVEITTKFGYKLRCSIDHPILSDVAPKAKLKNVDGKRIAIRQWKFREAGELKEGDFVGLANSIDYWGNISFDRAYLVGLLIGDSTYIKGNSCRILSADPETWEYVESNNYGVINHCDYKRPEKYNTEVRTYRIINGMSLMKWLGIAYQYGNSKTLPKNIGDFDKESVCKLIAGLFDSDGSIFINEQKEQYSITLYQSNKALLEEVRWQLRKLGIFSTIEIRKPANYILRGKEIHSKESYRLQVLDKASIINFYNSIHLNIKRKENNLERIYKFVQLNREYSEHNSISGAKQAKIISVKYIGLQTVYNLQADYDHTYLAEGIITHNTVQDALLNSDGTYALAGTLATMGPVGSVAGAVLAATAAINGFAGHKADTITKNEDVFANIGGSYTGTENKVDEALLYSGKKYGIFSSGARAKANRKIREAKRQQSILESINEEVVNQQAAKDYMGSMYNTQYTFDQQGGYQQAVTVGRMGMKLQSARDILKNRMMQGELNISDFTSGELNLSPIEEVGSLKVARMGGTLELSRHCKSSTEGVLIPHNCTTGELNITIIGNNGKTEKIKYKHGGKTDEPEEDNDYTFVDTQKVISQILKKSKKIPNFIKRIVDEPYVRTIYFINPKTGKKEWGSHFIASSNFMGKEIIYPLIQQTENGGLQFFDQEEALGRALKNEDFLIADSPEDAEIFGRYYKEFFDDKFGPGNAMYLYIGSGGKDNTLPTNFEGTPIMKKGGVLEENVEVQPLENKGGDINVIPDGALHARLNHIDNEDLTRKGIPVVSNDGEQQAEIENSEIILRLALTERLEMLSEQYDTIEDKDEKDRIVIEAGKLLVDEILNNTIDNTKNLL